MNLLVNGSNLLREKLTLPRDFQGRFNLVFIAFEQWQQMEVDSWMALAKELEEQSVLECSAQILKDGKARFTQVKTAKSKME
jgi:hypothetical protein